MPARDNQFRSDEKRNWQEARLRLATRVQRISGTKIQKVPVWGYAVRECSNICEASSDQPS